MPRHKGTYRRAPIKMLPSIERLKECFDYDPETGELRRRAGRLAGKIAGTINKHGYGIVYLDGQYYRIHRIAFKMMTGRDAEQLVDHKDGNLGNNRWTNLREATFTQSSRNRGKLKNNTTGHRGVYLVDGRWMAKIGVDGVSRYLGDFKSAEDAAEAYNAAAREIFGEFYRST